MFDEHSTIPAKVSGLSMADLGGEGEKMSPCTAAPMTVCEVVREEIRHVKWRVLIVACFLTFGGYYIYDFPSALGTVKSNSIQERFHQRGKRYDEVMNQLLYSVYSYPNTVLAVFGGLLIDRLLGLRKAMLLFTTLVFLGSLLFWTGVQQANFPLMVAARVLFGLGGESLSVAQSAFVARWFCAGRGMALAFGITISFSRVGSSVSFLISPRLAAYFGVEWAVLAGAVACCVSVLSCFVLILCDVYAAKKGWVPPEASGEASGGGVRLRDVRALPLEMWLMCAVCTFCYCAIFPFVGIAALFFQVKYGDSDATAGTWVALYQFSSAGFSPIAGAVVDRFGRYPTWLVASSAAFAGIHVLFLATPIPPYLLTLLMGISYSFLVSGLWPSVPFAVPSGVVGLSYGIMTALQNAGLATFPLISGAILDANTPKLPRNETLANTTIATDSDGAPTPTLRGFQLALSVFAASAAISAVASAVLLVVDRARSGVLSAAPAARAELIRVRDVERRRLTSVSPSEITTPRNTSDIYASD